MRILQINYSDYRDGGGGSIAMYRLYTALKKNGVDCKILSAIKTLNSPDSSQIIRSQRLENAVKKVISNIGLNDIHHVNSFNLKNHYFYQDADILNFHIIHSGYFNYLAIPSLTKNKPAVFTLHDMWSFTGHCAYSYDCDRWKNGCGKCPYPNSYPAVARDNTRLEWKLKNWVYNHSNLTIVTLSHWLDEQVKQSMLKHLPIYHIPNGIDTEAYQPLDSEQCRLVLGIPSNKKVLMFGAESLKDSRKGGDLLVKALSSLPDSLKAETILLTLGHGGESISETVGITSLNLGYVSSDRLKSIAFSAADLFVFPTRADNLPLVLQESMACGTPMVSFKVGGVPDLVRPGITGYLASPEDANDFCNGIVQLLEDQNLRHTMSQNCRAIAIEEYALETQAKKYISLYEKILTK
ncbi:MAG: glycosyltransferase family 4 protein [Nostocales cyanobacterium 94392]|nr:glycosyltransferase family 4 protein [Nostocales cyanobacterium 94392]